MARKFLYVVFSNLRLRLFISLICLVMRIKIVPMFFSQQEVNVGSKNLNVQIILPVFITHGESL